MEPEYDMLYLCWKDDRFLGIATFKKDPNIGDAFIKQGFTKSGQPVNIVYVPDTWDQVIHFEN